MAWKKLRKRNEWEKITVSAGGKKIKKGEYKIRWPDGEVETVNIETRIYTRSYMEQGDKWETFVTSYIPTITIEYHGSTFSADLHKVDCEVWVEDGCE